MQPSTWLVLAVVMFGSRPSLSTEGVVEDKCVGSRMNFKCGEQQYEIRGVVNELVEVECENKKLSCSSFPRKAFTNNSTIKNVTLSRCVMDEPIMCFLDKMGIVNVDRLALNKFPALFTGRYFEGLDGISTLVIDQRGPDNYFPINDLYRTSFFYMDNSVLHNLRYLKKIEIRSPKHLILAPRVFADLINLSDLNLDSCHIRGLPSTTLHGSMSLLRLSLSENQINILEPELFRDQTQMLHLDLSRNLLRNITCEVFLTLKKLNFLNLSYNQLETFSDDLFSALINLQVFIATNNRLKQIGPRAFHGVPLRILRLSYNQLSFNSLAKKDDQPLMTYCPFQEQKQLRTLDLKGNLIDDICRCWQMVMIKLESLDLSYNRISKLKSSHFFFLASNLVMNLTYNNISTVESNLSITERSAERSNSSFILGHNPFTCDCQVHFFVKVATSFEYSKYFNLNGIQCTSPIQLKGTNLAEVPLDRLVCEITCPPKCHCIDVPNKGIVDAECSEADAQMSNITKAVALKLTRKPKSLQHLSFQNVDKIDLSGLALNEVYFDDFPESVKFMNLSNNSLNYLPSNLLRRGMKLALRDNALRCDCWNYEQVHELQSNSVNIVDYDELKCEDGIFVSHVDVQRICDVWKATVIAVVIIGFGILFIIISVIIAYKYSFEVKIYVSKYLTCLLLEEKYDASKKYDVFVSYAHQDEEFLRDELLPKLESPPISLKTCLHSRDWLVGESIPYNIAKSVEESRRTLIVLSENFLQSIWGLLEFRAAHVQATKEGRTRVVVILLEDVMHRKDLDKEISAYLHTNTYIKWGDPWFWDKLAYALPKGRKIVDRRDEKRLLSVAKELHESKLEEESTKDQTIPV